MLTLRTHWEKYPKHFERLEEMTFDDRGNQVWGRLRPPKKGGKIAVPDDIDVTVFRYNGDFKIGKDTYIHKNFVTWGDPYSLYWYFRYRDWFEQNDIL